MVLLALLAATTAAAVSQPAATTAVRQAQATVTIIKAPVIHFQEIERSNPQLLRDTEVRSPDGTIQRARLVEFQ